MNRRFRRTAHSIAALVAVAGGGSVGAVAFSVTAAPTAGATVLGPLLYVGNETSTTVPGTIKAFAVGDTGDVHPTVQLTTGTTKAGVDLAFDGAGDLWAVSTSDDTVDEYTAAQLAAGGAQPPHISIGGFDSSPGGLVFDGAGDLWVSQYENDQIDELTPTQLTQTGTPTPSVVISSDGTHSLTWPLGMAIDPAGNLWVADNISATLVAFHPTQLTSSGSPVPAVTLHSRTTDFVGLKGLAFDAAGDLWASNFESDAVAEIAASSLASSGDPVPETLLSHGGDSGSLAFDGAGDLWVTQTEDTVAGTDAAVIEFTPTQLTLHGLVKPARTIEGANPDLSEPTGLAIPVRPTITSMSITSGMAGTTITVHGTNFTPGTTLHFGGPRATTVVVISPFLLTAKVPPGTGRQAVTAHTFAGFSETSETSTITNFQYVTGYDLVGSDGGVFVFNPAGVHTRGFYGSLPGIHVVPSHPIVGMVPTVDDNGYFLVGSDGGVFAFGAAPFLGSLPGIHVVPNQPIVGIVAADTDTGYFLVGRDGGVYAFGTVAFSGSLPAKGESVSNVIGISATPTGSGYWVVQSTGKVTAFGGAKTVPFTGKPTGPITSIAGTHSGAGYWLTTADGHVFPEGNAPVPTPATLPAIHVVPGHPIIGLVPTLTTQAYWLLGSDGGIFAFGAAPYDGSLPGDGVAVTNIVGAVPN